MIVATEPSMVLVLSREAYAKAVLQEPVIESRLFRK
jgi:hypothetical protein